MSAPLSPEAVAEARRPLNEHQLIGRRLRRLRDAEGMTQQEAADVLGIARPAYTLLESGKRRLLATEAVLLARRYGVGVDFIADPGPEWLDLEFHAAAARLPEGDREDGAPDE